MAKKKGKAPRKLSSTKALARRSEGISPSLFEDVRRLIESARQRVGFAVNSELVLLYWQMGKRIREDVLRAGRAEYGKRIVHTLCAQLTAEFGPGFTRRNVFNMLRFAEVFPDESIVHTL